MIVLGYIAHKRLTTKGKEDGLTVEAYGYIMDLYDFDEQ